MARVNIEQKAFTDARFSTLGRLIGATRHDALGRMALVWNHCQEVERYALSADTLSDLHPDVANFVDAICTADLAVKMGKEFYIRGTRGRVEWLANRRQEGREHGHEGGRPPKGKEKKKTPRGLPDVTQRGNRRKTPPALALAPAPAGTVEKDISHYAGAKRLPSGARFDFLLERYRQFHDNVAVKEMQAADPDAYAEEFRNAIGYDPDEFERLRAQMAGESAAARPSAYVLRLAVVKRRATVPPSSQIPLPFVFVAGVCA